MKIAVISASLGGFDNKTEHVTQSIPHDYFTFTDENFPTRYCSMTSRLQAKIPKMFGWQLAPGYDIYVWIDGNLTMTSPDTLKWLLSGLEGRDLAVLRHPRRTTVKWEARYMERGLKQGSRYMYGRYAGELLGAQMAEITADKDFVDDLLVLGGFFAYRNIPEIHAAFKEWWYHVSRYNVQDQISFSYILKKSGLKVGVLQEIYNDCPYLSHCGHVRHN